MGVLSWKSSTFGPQFIQQLVHYKLEMFAYVRVVVYYTCCARTSVCVCSGVSATLQDAFFSCVGVDLATSRNLDASQFLRWLILFHHGSAFVVA